MYSGLALFFTGLAILIGCKKDNNGSAAEQLK
jgi:hypothetical protein